MLVHTLALPFAKINAKRIYWEGGIAPVLCRQALAHVPAVPAAQATLRRQATITPGSTRSPGVTRIRA
jgi:hypothetical protein